MVIQTSLVVAMTPTLAPGHRSQPGAGTRIGTGCGRARPVRPHRGRSAATVTSDKERPPTKSGRPRAQASSVVGTVRVNFAPRRGLIALGRSYGGCAFARRDMRMSVCSPELGMGWKDEVASLGLTSARVPG